MEIPRITPDEVAHRQRRGERITFLDARSAAASARATEQIPGSIRVPPDDLDRHLASVPRHGTAVAYCT